MSVDLDELERLANAASPMPWVASVADGEHQIYCPGAQEYVARIEPWSPQQDAADAAFIAAARTAVPELVAEVRRLRGDFECAVKEGRRHEKRISATEAEIVSLYYQIAEWKEATGLTRGGDPGGVTPADLRTHIQALSRVERAAWRLVKMTVHDRGRCHPSMVGEETCYLCDLATAVNALPKEAP